MASSTGGPNVERQECAATRCKQYRHCNPYGFARQRQLKVFREYVDIECDNGREETRDGGPAHCSNVWIIVIVLRGDA